MKMMKRYKFSLFITASLCIFLSVSLYGQSPKKQTIEQVPLKATTSPQKMSEMISKTKQEETKPYQQFQQQVKMRQQQMEEGNREMQKRNKEALGSKPTQPKQCNCYDQNDPNNTDTDNFNYDSRGNRKSRIDPPCTCLPHKKIPQTNYTSDFSTPTQTAPQEQNNNTKTKQKSSSDNWGIQY